jgi:hypothetical protein
MSTGFTALLLSMAVCNNVTVYGMPDEDQCRSDGVVVVVVAGRDIPGLYMAIWYHRDSQ